MLLFCFLTAIPVHSQTFSILANFNQANGYDPLGTLVQGLDGNLYGTTSGGGAGDYGTVFRITPSGILTTIHSFIGADGWSPAAGLSQGTNGSFYGTTQIGGAIIYEGLTFGTVFKITPSGTLTTLYSFCFVDAPYCFDGDFPQAPLIQANSGVFYGTTESGGTNGGYGTIFKITPGGTFATVHSFSGNDGSEPVAGLLQAANGNLYGTTKGGGNNCGTIFEMTPNGTLTTLYSFNCTDGQNPLGLVHASNLEFYGMTGNGGSGVCGTYPNYYGCGTIFGISPNGKLKTLHNFRAGAGGSLPFGSLIQATDGNFYGVTFDGGTGGCTTNGIVTGCGTIFKIAPNGTFTTLHSFDGTNGGRPQAGLIQATNGNFYGTTPFTLFTLSVGLGPFVTTLPVSGKVGGTVKILGTDLTDAISVTFNGVPSKFTVVSATEITTTVPTGATTGNLQVVTPGGTLLSNVSFQVIP